MRTLSHIETITDMYKYIKVCIHLRLYKIHIRSTPFDVRSTLVYVYYICYIIIYVVIIMYYILYELLLYI